MTNTTNGPADHVRLGAISAAIWANETEKGVRYGVTFERLYRDPNSGSWKSSATFNRDDLLVIAKVADMAHTRIHEMQQADRSRNRDNDGESEPEGTEPKPPAPRAGGASASTRARAKAKAGAGR